MQFKKCMFNGSNDTLCRCVGVPFNINLFYTKLPKITAIHHRNMCTSIHQHDTETRDFFSVFFVFSSLVPASSLPGTDEKARVKNNGMDRCQNTKLNVKTDKTKVIKSICSQLERHVLAEAKKLINTEEFGWREGTLI